MSRLSIGLRGAYSDTGQNTDGIGNREPNTYHPIVSVLLLLVLFELAFIFLMRFGFRHTHGG